MLRAAFPALAPSLASPAGPEPANGVGVAGSLAVGVRCMPLPTSTGATMLLSVALAALS